MTGTFQPKKKEIFWKAENWINGRALHKDHKQATFITPCVVAGPCGPKGCVRGSQRRKSRDPYFNIDVQNSRGGVGWKWGKWTVLWSLGVYSGFYLVWCKCTFIQIKKMPMFPPLIFSHERNDLENLWTMGNTWIKAVTVFQYFSTLFLHSNSAFCVTLPWDKYSPLSFPFAEACWPLTLFMSITMYLTNRGISKQ